ncbi:MAG: GatB/YqeY domain-containing protein [Alphaproteobacteria bacterium]|nr:MAG: GatB/YqeY domain-containing protein [Alphaproteobacteria bacterium]
MLRDQLGDALKAALKAKDARRTATLRLILAAIKDRDISLRGEGKPPVDDTGIIEILGKMIKQRKESIKAYEEGGRLELVEQEQQEIEIIEEFLPPQLTEAELESVCQKTVADLEATSLKDMGRVMGQLKEKYAGQMDFSKAGAIVRELLTSPS